MTDHMSRLFEEELLRLKGLVMTMGSLTIEQLERALQAADHLDTALATRVIEHEPEANRLEHEIDNLVVRVLALRQPLAIDLRHALSALRIGSELERICDHAKDFAERLIALAASGNARLRSLINLGRFAMTMVKDAMHAYQEADARQAADVWNRDKELDEMYTALFRELLTYMAEDARRISASTQMLFMARDIERVGDRATNIAEMVSYLVSGVPVEEERQKADATKSLVLTAAR
jgi:phosphate transport system protein